jgi:hypothetical protein
MHEAIYEVGADEPPRVISSVGQTEAALERHFALSDCAMHGSVLLCFCRVKRLRQKETRGRRFALEVPFRSVLSTPGQRAHNRKEGSILCKWKHTEEIREESNFIKGYHESGRRAGGSTKKSTGLITAKSKQVYITTPAHEENKGHVNQGKLQFTLHIYKCIRAPQLRQVQ